MNNTGKSSSGKSSSGLSSVDSTGKKIYRTTKRKSKDSHNKTSTYKESEIQSKHFTKEERDLLRDKLRDIGFDDNSEIHSLVRKLGIAAHVYSGEKFEKLIEKIDEFGNYHDGTIQFKRWLDSYYSKLVKRNNVGQLKRHETKKESMRLTIHYGE